MYSRPAVAAGARWTLFVLALVYALNYVDRQLIVILQEAIKADLELADWQLGLLSGIAFAAFYTVLGVPIARAADRSNRRNIIAVAVAVWSLMTAICGTAQVYWQLLLARIGVGVGEAGCSPPAHSMISDLYPPAQRATALSIYNLGVYLGVLVGYVAGGWLNEWFGWRMAFFILGLPGVAMALLVWLAVPEPARAPTATPAFPATRDVLRLLANRPTFRHLALAAGLHAFVGYGVGNWVPSFFIRSHGLSTGELGTWLGPIAAGAGAIGALGGGYLADRLGRTDARWNVWLPAIAILCSVPVSIAVYLTADFRVALLLSVIPVLLGATYLGPTLALTHGLVNARMRAVASSVLLLVLNLVGMGLGPWITGLLSDLLQPTLGAESLRWALVIVILGNVWCALHYLLAAKTLRADLARAPM
jgi:MFS family permease